MPNYTTRLLQGHELELAIDFAWPIAQHHEYFYFPFYNSYDELKIIFSRFFEKEGLYLIGIFEGSILVALFPLVFRESEEIGGWDKGIYIHDEKIKYSNAMDIFKTFISDDLGFEGKEIYCGIRSDYQDAIKCFEREGSEILEETHITNFEFISENPKNLNVETIVLDPFIEILNINDVTICSSQTILNAYYDYHDKAYPGYYWTSERLKNHLHDFRIIIAFKYSMEQEVIILGSIFVREIEGTGDVYGLSNISEQNSNCCISGTTVSSEILREALLHKALQNSHANGLKSMMFFCEEINDYHLALRKGFKTMGNYKVYLWNLK